MKTRRLHLAVFALAAFVRCGDEQPAEQVAPVDSGKAKTAPKVPVAPSPEQPDNAYSYSPIGKRDPFRSYIADLRETARGDDERRPETTEKYELDQYRLTGLVTGTSQQQVMVEDPDNMGYVLRVGARIGKNGGRITRIATDQMIVTEEFRAPTGE
ncbi:MAG: pilus assembly protein PilP, partial [Clostridia bacterium]|nr:pilus assembly protein PilP [Deltaproteobacteria bacterium]